MSYPSPQNRPGRKKKPVKLNLSVLARCVLGKEDLSTKLLRVKSRTDCGSFTWSEGEGHFACRRCQAQPQISALRQEVLGKTFFSLEPQRQS